MSTINSENLSNEYVFDGLIEFHNNDLLDITKLPFKIFQNINPSVPIETNDLDELSEPIETNEPTYSASTDNASTDSPSTDSATTVSATTVRPSTKFGIATISVSKLNALKAIIDLYFSVDCSGSMNDGCKDGRSKMQHIIHTIVNILYILAETKDLIFNICVQAFDHKIYSIIEFTTLTPENVVVMVEKVKRIRPIGSTDLKLPLIRVNEIMNERIRKFPKHRKIHIEMTDGEDTCNRMIRTEYLDVLYNLMNSQIKNIVIGFGEGHDSAGLIKISSCKNGEYKFIAELEKSGFVYGEIINDILYLVAEQAVLKIENGLIYDWKTNTWNSELEIGNLISDTKKVYHIQSATPELVFGTLTGISLSDPLYKLCDSVDDPENGIPVVELLTEVVKLPPLLDVDDTFCDETGEPSLITTVATDTTNLDKYIYRQNNHQLLFKVLNLCNLHPIPNDIFGVIGRGTQTDINTNNLFREMKTELTGAFEYTKSYMTDNGLLEDPFWKILLDDLYVSLKTIGTPYATMYTTARSTSQGNQETYTVSAIPEMANIGGLRRHYAFNSLNGLNGPQDDDYDEDEDNTDTQLNHNLTTDLDDTINIRRVSLMRAVSN